LQGFDRGTRKDRRRHVTDGERRLAFGIAYGDGAAMPALDQRPADHFQQDGIGHRLFLLASRDVARCDVSRQSGRMLCNWGRLCIIIPALDEAAIIVATLQALAPLRRRGAEIIVVDGGSSDGTPALARSIADRVMSAPRSRGAAMNAGAALANGDV